MCQGWLIWFSFSTGVPGSSSSMKTPARPGTNSTRCGTRHTTRATTTYGGFSSVTAASHAPWTTSRERGSCPPLATGIGNSTPVGIIMLGVLRDETQPPTILCRHRAWRRGLQRPGGGWYHTGAPPPGHLTALHGGALLTLTAVGSCTPVNHTRVDRPGQGDPSCRALPTPHHHPSITPSRR